MTIRAKIFDPLELPCGTVLKNRIVKSAMSDSLADGTGHPTTAQNSLYARWAEGGVAASIIGEVQGGPDFAEKPGNLVLNEAADLPRFRELAKSGACNGAHLWLQLGHAGALAYAPTSAPKGPSVLDLPKLSCGELTLEEIRRVPKDFADSAKLAKELGFGGVEVHAAHGFLLSQFLSPLFNRRQDTYGGSIANRMRLILETIEEIRAGVGSDFPIAIKLNSTDKLEGGLENSDALEVVKALDRAAIDLIDISGGTYFPGAKSMSDGAGGGPYFLEFARQARQVTTKPLMLTGGFKEKSQAEQILADGAVDVIGLARALVLEPNLPDLWESGQLSAPVFPKFTNAPKGGITAWFTMRLTEIAAGQDHAPQGDLSKAIADYEERDAARTEIWLRHFGPAA